MYLIKIRSYAVAAFIIGHGVEPVDAVQIDGRVVFRFPATADPVMDTYTSVKTRLDALARHARPVANVDEINP